MSEHASDGPGFEDIWAVPDAGVASGRFPGYVGAVRIGERVEVRASGTRAIEPDSPPMTADTLFRIASISKPIGGALTLSMVQDGTLSLDDPIATWLPEAAHPQVLVDPRGPLDRTTPAVRPITVRHLLTCASGWGLVLDETPLQAAMIERQVFSGPLPRPLSADEYVARLTALPLLFQPGEGWAYDTSIDLLGVLLARAGGRPLSELLAERITGPLGMTSTAFWTADVARLATAYAPGADGLTLLDPPDGAFSRPPACEQLGGGLVSTAPDVLRFFCAMADGGSPVLSGESVASMTADALTDAQRRRGAPILAPGESWGLGTGVEVEAAEPWMVPGRWGWSGGTGTTAGVDPVHGAVAVLLTQRAMGGPDDGFIGFWTAVSHAAAGAG